jgi:(R,R)-butanediol dehydrogenase/meso-butanediol dehydrogenase/diacetyl reductase
MRAVRLYGPLDLRVEDVDAPASPPPGFVNLKVRAAGICGSDLHNYKTGQWISRSPSTVGHEFCGTVIAIGEGVTEFKIGDHVVADSRVSCGSCPACRDGRPNTCERLGFVGEACDGGFAEQVQLPARLLVHHAPSLAPAIAAMAEPLAVALHAVRRLSPPAQEPVLVIGCGAIGALCALVIAHEHKAPLLLADRNAERVDLVARVTGGVGVELDKRSIGRVLSGRSLRYAIDGTGNLHAIRAGLELLSGGGALALVGIGQGRLELDPNSLVEREIALIGCHAFLNELPEAVALLPKLSVALHEFCRPIPTLDDVPGTYQQLIDGRSPKPKSIIEL